MPHIPNAMFIPPVWHFLAVRYTRELEEKKGGGEKKEWNICSFEIVGTNMILHFSLSPMSFLCQVYKAVVISGQLPQTAEILDKTISTDH